MMVVLANPTYRYLFFAQVVALLGTGLATVALGLLAYDLSGENAGAVLGTALAIKMIAYVCVAPIAAAFVGRLPRKETLIALDGVRAAVVLFLPFVTEIWQIYCLVFLLQSASAAFTPTFQATIPDVLPGERDYTRALSLSRLAYDLESLASPAIAAALLTMISFNSLFIGTAIGFVVSAMLVSSVILANPKPTTQRGIYDRTTRGGRIFLATPRLRGLLAVNFAAACAGAIIFVNSVVFVQGQFALGPKELAFALAAFGNGSMLVALILPRLLERTDDRKVMLGATILLALLAAGTALIQSFPMLLVFWFAIGIGYSLALTPSGRLLRRSSKSEDRPALFAAQFALSHACWLITYPLAGWGGVAFGLPATSLILAALASVAVIIAIRVWPAQDAEVVEHVHDGLAADHPHWKDGINQTGDHHAHTYQSDELHSLWPQTH
jgi:MFS family permease